MLPDLEEMTRSPAGMSSAALDKAVANLRRSARRRGAPRLKHSPRPRSSSVFSPGAVARHSSCALSRLFIELAGISGVVLGRSGLLKTYRSIGDGQLIYANDL